MILSSLRRTTGSYRFFLCVTALLCFIVLPGFSVAVSQSTTEPQDDAPAVNFVEQIQPILRDHCYDCHAGTTEEGSLNLGIRSKALTGGDSGPAIHPGQSDDSLLIQLVSGAEEGRVMPPDGNTPLTDTQIDLLRTWIQQGATWPENTDVANPKLERAKNHWSFQRLHQPVVPAPTSDDWGKNEIDQFVIQRLNDVGLRPAPPADARTLVRRLYFDLIGLPPSPQQTQEFVTDYGKAPDTTVAQLIDQLLASPRYGERWARHWLDVARYADSAGQEADNDRPQAYRYRDFVIQAFNDNMPYDQFVRWQIAGDEYQPNNDVAVAATGFLTAGTCYKLGDSFLESERLLNRYNELDDVISTLGSGMLGLTVACARCHDHKYDAFSAKEYYQLLGVFHSGDRVEGKLPSGKDGFFFQDFDSERRTTWLFRRSDFYDREIEVDLGFPVALTSDRSAEDYWEKAKQDSAKWGETKSTLQRRALGDWITDSEHGGGALLARVMVNRIWHHHFGKGIVATTGDFGVQGDRPTHPELLEHLTNEFVASGWDIKALHRKILSSAVWQQSSSPTGADPRGREVDPGNQLLWRRDPVRLEVEVMRDTMLAVSQTLNLEAGGPGFKPYIAPEANLARNLQGERYPQDAKDDESTRRRSVYMFHKRLIPYPMFQAFDRPDLMTTCTKRQTTTVAPQAMVILNDRFVRNVAHDFALLLSKHQHADSENSPPTKTMIQEAFEIAFARQPSEKEIDASLQFIQSQTKKRTERSEPDPKTEALTDYCQSLFGLNEFIYVD